ncbi:hypothetical protein BH20ACT20_BH20ACT20_11560 [soil metagenome]
MSEKNINHFLVVYDIAAGLAHVEQFAGEYERAVMAYNEEERRYREDVNIEVVLLGSDSLETLHRTHSSYFELHDKHADQIVARELAELGLR